MRTAVSAEEMRWCDATAIRSFGIPSLILMENAGKGAADRIAQSYGPMNDRRIVVLCGKGNNGGDGMVVARHLLNRGAIVNVVLLASRSGIRGDAKENFAILTAIARQSERLTIRQYSRARVKDLRPDLVVDALLGTGSSGLLKEPYASAVDWINARQAPVVSLDIPSGIDGTTGLMANKAVRAHRTITMGALKTGLLCNQGRESSGVIETVDIGIPSHVYQSKLLRTFLVEEEDVRSVLPKRKQSAHKYSAGKVFILAGARGFTGAAALTALGALRSGAGAVILGTPEAVYPILARKLSETIVVPLPSTEEGSLSVRAKSLIEERMQWADVSVIGPGLSQQSETTELVRDLVSSSRGKMLVDADGLNAIAPMKGTGIRGSKASIILTPHGGELSRLTGVSSGELEKDRIEQVRRFSRKSRATVVFKGAPTATGTPAGEVYLNSTGNPGMATVGSGDVLTGIIAGLWAQGAERSAAAYAGVWLHGKAGDLAKEKMGERGIVAQDLIDFLPAAAKWAEVRD